MLNRDLERNVSDMEPEGYATPWPIFASPVMRVSSALAVTTLLVGHYRPARWWLLAPKILSRTLSLGLLPMIYVMVAIDESGGSIGATVEPPFSTIAEWLCLATAVSIAVMGEREIRPDNVRLLNRELRFQDHEMAGRDVLVMLVTLLPLVQLALLIRSIVQFDPHPTARLVRAVGEKHARGVDTAIYVLYEICIFVWTMGIFDLLLRLHWWMVVAVGAVERFREDVLDALAGLRTMPNSALKRSSDVPTRIDDACDLIEERFERARTVAAALNRIFEVPASLAVTFTLLLACTIAWTAGAETDTSVRRELYLSSLVLASAGVGLLVWMSRLGDTFVAAKAELVTPTVQLRMQRALTKERADVIASSLDKTHVAFEVGHVPMTTSTVVKIIFGVALTLGITVVHMTHEAHREHVIAHEILHGLRPDAGEASQAVAPDHHR